MSVVPPLGTTRWTRYDPDSSSSGEALALHVGRLHSPQGDYPVMYFHDYLATPDSTMDGAFDGLFTAVASTSYPMIVPRLGGTSQWATPDVVDAGGWVDDALDWANSSVWIGTSETKVAVIGVGMGSLNALNWAWRNPGKVLAVVLIGPIVDADKFYNDNPGLQAAINADWGSGAAWTAALPDIDPMQNLALIRPFGHKIKLWYGDADTQIDGADVRAFAELAGAEAVEFAGTEAQRHRVPSGPVAMFTLATIREKARAYVGWDDRDWGRFREVILTQPPVVADRNTNDLRTAVWPGGRRGEFHKLSGGDGNERYGYLLNEFSATDGRVQNIWYQEDGGLMVGQHGNILRADIDDDAGTYLMYVTWGDIFGVSPWIVNRAVWSGIIGGNSLTLLGSVNSTIPGLRLSAGGEVLASERVGGVVTLVVHEADLDRAFRSRTLDVDISGPLGDHIIIGATRLDANHIRYAQAGADILNGGAGSWADFGSCYPFNADSDLVGNVMRGRFYPIGMDPPPMGDPDWGFTWTDTGGWGPTGYGGFGAMYNHVGLFDLDRPHFIQTGPLMLDEL